MPLMVCVASATGAGAGAALVLGARPLAETVIVDGKIVVERGELVTGDVEEIARELNEVALR